MSNYTVQKLGAIIILKVLLFQNPLASFYKKTRGNAQGRLLEAHNAKILENDVMHF